MGYKVYYEELTSVLSGWDEINKSWSRKISRLLRQSKNLQNSSFFTGAAADSIKLYFSEVHDKILEKFAQVISAYDTQLKGYYGGYINRVDGGTTRSGANGEYAYNTFVKSELAEGGLIPHRFKEYMNNAQWRNNTVESIRRSISSILWISSADGESFVAKIDAARRIALETDDRVEAHELSHKGDLRVERALLKEIENIIDHQLSSKRISVVSYASGQWTQMCNVQQLDVAYNASKTNESEIQQSVDFDQGSVAVQEVEEYQKWERAEKAKWIKVGIAVVAGVGMAIATVATGGLAAVAVCAAIGAAEGVATSVTDIYVEKGKGTGFLDNVFSEEFAASFDYEDRADMIKGGIVGGISGAITGGMAGGTSSVGKTFAKEWGKNLINSESKVVIGAAGDVVETVVVGNHKGKSSDEIWSDIGDVVSDSTGKIVNTAVSTVATSGFDLGFEKLNDRIDANKYVEDFLIKPIEEGVTGIGERTAEETTKYLTGQQDSINWQEDVFSVDAIVEDVGKEFTKNAAKNVGDTIQTEEAKFRLKIKQKAFMEKPFKKPSSPTKITVTTYDGTRTGVLAEDHIAAKGLLEKDQSKARSELGVRSVNNPITQTVDIEDLEPTYYKPKKGESTKIRITKTSNS